MNDIPNTTGGRIEQLIQEKGIMKKVFATDMGVSVQTVSHWLHNKGIPNPSTLKEIAVYFGVNPDYLKCKTKYRTRKDETADVMKHSKEQIEGLFAFLESAGYTIEISPYSVDVSRNYYKSEAYLGNNCDNIPIQFSIYEITTPKNEKKLIDFISLQNWYSLCLDIFEKHVYSHDLVKGLDIKG